MKKVQNVSPAEPCEALPTGGNTVGLSIRIASEDGPIEAGTRFELLFNHQVIGDARTTPDGTLLFPVELGPSSGLVLRMATNQFSPKGLLDGPKGPEVERWLGPALLSDGNHAVDVA